MTPDHATFLAEQFTDLIAQEVPSTLKVLRAVPEAGREFRPDAKSRTAWDLATHIAQSDVWFLDSIAAGAFAFDPAAAQALIGGFGSVADVAAYYERAMPEALARVRALSTDDLLRDVDFFGLFKKPAVGYLAFANNHSVHHRGQLSTYLRPMGAKVPAIVGPSGDEGFGG